MNKSTLLVGKVLFSAAIFLSAIQSFGWGGIFKPYDPDERLVYLHAFHLVDTFNKEAKKRADSSDRDFFEQYFAKNTGLTYDQDQVLKSLAEEFVKKSRGTDHSRRMELIQIYIEKVREAIGDEGFQRLDSFVKVKFQSNSPEGYGGHSSVMLDEANHKLIGVSTTVAYDLHSSPNVTCSVSATMTGPGVNVSDSASNSCSENPTVTLMSTTYQDGFQYCINGTHTRINTYNSQDCLTTPVPHVANVEYELI